MAVPVEMPKLGNTVEQCLLSRWTKRAGERVAEGETLAEIETDKATFELPAPASGTLLATFFPDGELVPVYTNICVIGEPGENAEAFRSEHVGQASTPARDVYVPHMLDLEVQRSPGGLPHSLSPQAGALSPRARRFAAEHGMQPPFPPGSGPNGRVLEQDLRNAFFSSPRASGLARKLMEEGAEVRGEPSGAAGSVYLAADLSPAPVKMTGVRERIARRMRDSLSTTAQYTLHTSADATGLLALRARIKAAAQRGAADVNINDLVVFCAIRALGEMPELNAELIDGKIYRHERAHIGFACDTPKGLLVPVVKDAHELSVAGLAGRLKELAQQAAEGSIAPDDLTGATFTVSNLGSFGIESFTPIINPTQVAVLGVDAIQLKPVRRNGEIAFIDSIGLSLTLDHQVIDGAPGARFLKLLRETIERVESIVTLES